MKESRPLVVVITGATNGIGLSTKELLNPGISTIVCDREPSDDKNYVFLDLSDPESISECVRSLPGQIDALINCAGVAPITQTNTAVLKINWFGTKSFTDAVFTKIKPTGSVTTVVAGPGQMGR